MNSHFNYTYMHFICQLFNNVYFVTKIKSLRILVYQSVTVDSNKYQSNLIRLMYCLLCQMCKLQNISSIYQCMCTYTCTCSPLNENLNLLIGIKFLDLFLQISIYLNIYIEKLTGPNKVVVALRRKTGAHREDYIAVWSFITGKWLVTYLLQFSGFLPLLPFSR